MPNSQNTEDSTNETNPASFEEAIEKLEAIVQELEDGQTSLDKLILKFEEGSKLVQNCRQQLQQAELKIEKLKTVREENIFEPFDPDQ